MPHQLGKLLQLFLIGEFAKQKKIGNFLKAQLILTQLLDQLLDLISPVPELSVSRYFSSVYNLGRSNFRNIGKPGQNTVTIFITKAEIHTIFLIQTGGNAIILNTYILCCTCKIIQLRHHSLTPFLQSRFPYGSPALSSGSTAESDCPLQTAQLPSHTIPSLSFPAG